MKRKGLMTGLALCIALLVSGCAVRYQGSTSGRIGLAVGDENSQLPDVVSWESPQGDLDVTINTPLFRELAEPLWAAIKAGGAWLTKTLGP